MKLSKDSREFIESLNSARVEYVIVGAHALAFHGLPRFTADIDIAVRPTPENAQRIITAIKNFGFEDIGLNESDFVNSEKVIQLGVAPNRIDLMTSLSGVSMDGVWESRVATDFDGVPVNVMSKHCLIANKKAAGRPQDISDVAFLESN